MKSRPSRRALPHPQGRDDRAPAAPAKLPARARCDVSSKQLTPKSLPDIGRRFGGRDTTVIHAVKQIEKLRAADAELDADIRLLTRQLEG